MGLVGGNLGVGGKIILNPMLNYAAPGTERTLASAQRPDIMTEGLRDVHQVLETNTVSVPRVTLRWLLSAAFCVRYRY